MRFTFSAVVVLLALGCAQSAAVQWTKADLDPQVLEQDLAECDSQARATATNQVPVARSIGLGMTSVTPGQVAPGATDRFQLEREARHDCMLRRGYRETAQR